MPFIDELISEEQEKKKLKAKNKKHSSKNKLNPRDKKNDSRHDIDMNQ